MCAECLGTTTETQLQKDAESGGLPYCYCKYSEGRIFINYKKISKKQYLKLGGKYE